MASTFADLGVPQALLRALKHNNITTPFDIQTATIPDALAGRDILGRAPTGSGKTLAFGIPMAARVGEGTPRRPRGLILSPTRELAEQIRREVEPLLAAANRTCVAIYGGVSFGKQTTAIRNGVDVLVACPGRLLDLIHQGEVSLDAVHSVVIDEADRMCDMGFLPSVRQLLDLTSVKRQTVLFSATLDGDVQQITDAYLTNPAFHEVGEVEPDLSTMEHFFVRIDHFEKVEFVADVVAKSGPTVVFCRTRHGVDRVARQLRAAGIPAGWIHGGRTQPQRDRALEAFTSGEVLALVATDVAARGIHVDGVAAVVHFNPPEDGKTYVHRSGRTARAGAAGIVVSLVQADEDKAVALIKKQAGLSAPTVSIVELRADIPERDPVQWPAAKKRDAAPKRGKKTGAKATTAGKEKLQRAENEPRSVRARKKTAKNDRTATQGRSSEGRSDAKPRPKREDRPQRSDRRSSGAKKDRSANDAEWESTTLRPKQRTASDAREAPKKKRSSSTKRSGKPRPKNKSSKRAGSSTPSRSKQPRR